MLLSELFEPGEILALRGNLDVPIERVVIDSREVRPGDLFVCLTGYRTEAGETRADRHDFVPMALQRGGRAFVVERDVAVPADAVVVGVADAWAMAALLSARLHGHPSRRLLTIGVTGTSGKTSSTYFLESVLRAADHRVARIGTIEYRLDDAVLPAAQTTPEAPLIQSLLRESVERGCTAAVMEVSSHALELKRVHGVEFDLAVFTNLSRDHLNFHPDMDSYLRAKGRLFEALGLADRRGCALVNADDPASEYVRRVNRGELLTFGLHTPGVDVGADDVRMSLRGISFAARTPNGEARVTLRHLGDYSVYNALAALAAGVRLGIDLKLVAEALGATPPVPGRFELIDEGQDFVVAVDYAHKPDALARLIDSARAMRPRRVITVFGCGGDRDRGKRPVMGRIAVERSDWTIVTSDNPRSEDPRAIVDEIVAGAREADPHARRFEVEVDRAAAIRRAIERAGADDIVLIAGKGHETYQLVAGQRFYFDDREHARTALRGRAGKRQ